MKEYTNNKMMLALAILSLCLFCVLFTCLVLIITGTATLSVSGFAVDNSERLYIGTTNEIRVYEDGKLINSINPHTSRTYVFTITEDEKILLSTSTKIYIMDLDGNILETKDDSGADTYNQISYRKRKFISANGDSYKLTSILGWTRIVKNSSETVYQIDTLSFAIKILVTICVIALLVFLIWALPMQRLEDRWHNQGPVSD